MNKRGALWQKKDKNGNPMFSGKMDEINILVFKNTKKNSDKHPDWIIYDTEKTKDEEVPF